jgi:hypothetical protein
MNNDNLIYIQGESLIYLNGIFGGGIKQSNKLNERVGIIQIRKIILVDLNIYQEKLRRLSFLPK